MLSSTRSSLSSLSAGNQPQREQRLWHPVRDPEAARLGLGHRRGVWPGDDDDAQRATQPRASIVDFDARFPVQIVSFARRWSRATIPSCFPGVNNRRKVLVSICNGGLVPPVYVSSHDGASVGDWSTAPLHLHR